MMGQRLDTFYLLGGHCDADRYTNSRAVGGDAYLRAQQRRARSHIPGAGDVRDAEAAWS